MAMQITREQTDWLTGFLARARQEVQPEMAVNTAGPATGGAPSGDPGLLERMDDSVNKFGAWVYGPVGRTEPVAPSAPSDEAATAAGISGYNAEDEAGY